MRKRMKQLTGILLALLLLISVAGASGAPVYAGGDGEDEPNIIWQTRDLWVVPGAVVYPIIDLDQPVSSVSLEHWNGVLNDFEWHDNCMKMDSGGHAWEGKIDPKTVAGDYITLRFRANFDGGYLLSDSFTIEWTDYYGKDRISGSNRYKTAFAIADMKTKLSGSMNGKYKNAIIACGTNYADALGGAYLSECYDAPILLVNDKPDVIDEVVMELMNHLEEGGMIFILGGEGAVSGEMEERLAAAGYAQSQIKRFSGKNRYDTNLQILKYCEVYRTEILVCSGTGFPDALSASAVGLPILLAGQSLSAYDLETVGSMKASEFIIIGGTGAVSETVEKQLKERAGEGYVTRLSGANRYETSGLVAERFFGDRQRMFVTLAYARNFPDGLAGGPLCLELNPGGPLILADNDHYMEAERTAALMGARHAFVLGGETLISDEVADRILHHPDLT